MELFSIRIQRTFQLVSTAAGYSGSLPVSLRTLLARKVQEPLSGGSRTAPFLSAFYRIAQRERSN